MDTQKRYGRREYEKWKRGNGEEKRRNTIGRREERNRRKERERGERGGHTMIKTIVLTLEKAPAPKRDMVVRRISTIAT